MRNFEGGDAYGAGSIAAHLRYLRETDIDYLKIMNDSLAYQPPEGVKIRKASGWRQIRSCGTQWTGLSASTTPFMVK